MYIRKFKFIIISFILISTITVFLFADATYVIDTPTTGMLDYGGYNLNFRLFSDGGVLTRLDFGVFRMVNLGFGWEMSQVIGTQDVSVAPPGLCLKIRPFEGGMVLPEFVIGFDGQGYFYDRDISEFTHKERGIFMALGREMLFPGFKATLGCNISDFKTNKIMGFSNVFINLEEKFVLLIELDNIHYAPENRVSFGFRFSITEDLTVDLAGRDVGAPADRDTERIVRVNYLGRF